jgi:MFS transporter, DHA1 family, multidrug resistance protein
VVPASDDPATGRHVDWRRNLAALWLAEFMAIFGFSFALPFLPLYLHQDLGVEGSRSLALWSGLVGGASGLGLAVASPLWGVLADRHGRKPMLVRAMLGGALMVGLIGFVRTAPQLLVLRLAQGMTSGTVPAATALAASETPRTRVAWAMGVLSSSVALGNALGPLVGGVAATVIGLRGVFVAAGALLAVSAIPVLLVVRERPPAPRAEGGGGARPSLRQVGRATLWALSVLVGGQALMQFSYAATQQLAVLHVLQVSPGHASTVTGAAFGAAGLATSLAAIGYSRLTGRMGYRWVAVAAAGLYALAIAAVGLAGTAATVVAAVGLYGLAYGALNPVLAALIGLRAPREVQATVYGLSASAIAIGIALGPIVGGAVAAATEVSTALYVAGGVAAALAVFLAVLARDPAPLSVSGR